MYDTSMHITPDMTIQALNEEIQRLNEITQYMDGFQETAELFKIGAVLGVSDDMGRGPDGGRPGPEHGEILAAVKKLREQNDTDRAQLANLSATRAPEISLEDALWRVEQELHRRGEVAPEQVIPRLMEAGLACQWVKDRPDAQRAYAGCSPELRTLQDAIHRAGATPYIRLDDGGYDEDDPPASLHLGWEVVRSESRPIINALHGFVINPGPHTFDVLMGYLRGSRMEILGDGPVAAWCRLQVPK